jgi:hypothetical protein
MPAPISSRARQSRPATPRQGPVQQQGQKGLAERVDHHLLRLSAVTGQKLDRADILEMMLETFETAQQGRDGAEARAAFANRDQPPENRAPGRTHEMRIWATDDVFTALTTEAHERGWTVSRVVEALLIEVTKTRARLKELEKRR